MVRSCCWAGFPRECFLTEADRLPPPLIASVCGALAVNTDDVSHFGRASAPEVKRMDLPPLALLDQGWTEQGIRAQTRKQCDLVSTGTVLGVDLFEGTQLTPALEGLVLTLLAATDLFNHRQATPREVNSLLGKLQWYGLLNRFLLSCFKDVYPFVDSDFPDVLEDVPPLVLDELALNVALAPFTIIDLTRGWMDIIPASDASEAYGFGLSSATAAPSLIRDVASLPYECASHVRCAFEEGAPAERQRDGNEYRLPFVLSRFKPILSQRSRWKTHSGGLEASAVAQSLRLLSRRRQLHSHRGVFLIDAQAVMHALRKGRTSAPTLWHPVRRCAALSLACDWAWRFQYVPSESNAADWPSRGVVYRREKARQRRRDQQRLNGRVKKYTKYERYVRDLDLACNILRKKWPQCFDNCASDGDSS